MNKNLKKVISAVSAIALSATTFASVSFAGSYTDVADTAANAEAIEVLSALGIINGYKDDATGDYSFKPENPIKRQEAAKLFVAIQNMLDAAEGRKGTTKFADVDETSAWATGYINLGVDKGYINGTSDTTYNPKGDIKYQDVIKVLVSIMGYKEDVVKSYGGYPNGYLSIADAEGITKGVSFDPTAPATRGNVAMLIYNAMKLPIVQPKGMQYSSVLGAYVPGIEKQDGEESKYYKSLLTEYFDAYVIEGTVTEIGKTGGSSLKSDEVNFKVSKGEKYDANFVDITDGKATYSALSNVKVGNTAADSYLNTYAVAIVAIDEDDNATFLSFAPSGKNKSVALDAGLLDDEDTAITDIFKTDTSDDVIAKPFVKYYATEDATRSTKYTLDPKFQIYVNGVEVDTNNANFKKYIYNNTVGSVELVDRYESGKATDGYYDIINVQYFDTARVDSVTSTRITFKDSTFSRSTLTLDKEDNEDLTYGIYYNDAQVAITDLKKDDILSIAYDVNAGITSSNFYDIYVSRDTQEGKYTTKDDDDKTVRVNGEDYKFVGDYASKSSSMTLSNEYKLYLDYFGRIYDIDTVTSSVKLAVVDRVVTSSSYDSGFGAVLYFPDGTAKTLEIDATKTGTTQKALTAKIYKGGVIDNSDKVLIQNRVAEYKLDNAGKKIIKLDFQAIAQSAIDSEYRVRTNAIGAVKMNSSTQIIDAQDYNDKTTPSYSDLKVGSLATTFKDGVNYTVYNFGTKNNSDGTYPLVIVTAGEGKYTKDTHFAVVSSAPRKTSDGSKEGYTVELLYNGEQKDFFVTDDANVNDKVITDDFTVDTKKGDIVVFDVNASQEITDIVTIFSPDATISIGSKYETTAEKFLAASVSGSAFKFNLPTKWLTGWSANTSDRASIVSGVILGKQSGYFTLGQIKDGKTYLDLQAGKYKKDDLNNVGGVIDYTITDNTKVSVFDYTKSRSADQYYAGGAADIVSTVVSDAYKYDEKSYSYKFDGEATETYEGEAVDWNGTLSGETKKNYQLIEMNFAFAKVVDGVATDVFVIKGYLN